MKKIIVLFVLLANLFGHQRVISVKENLYWLRHKINRSQYEIMVKVWNYAKPYNLQYTATAIAWQESRFGVWLHNLKDPSCGVFHQLLPDLADRYKIPANMWNMSRLCDNLMFFDYAFKTFIDTFHEKENICFNKGYRNKSANWRCAVESYNTYGNKIYYLNIRNKIRALRIFFKERGL